jgi:hypothetical protein
MPVSKAVAALGILLALAASAIGQENNSPLPSHFPLQKEVCNG